MVLIEWKDEYKTGIASVDYEHESMIRLLNELYACMKEKESKSAVLDFLGEVHARISAHFALEEKIMRERDYDQYAEHKADHEHLLDEIRDIMERYERSADVDYDEALSRELQAWFSDHFKSKDSRLHRMLG